MGPFCDTRRISYSIHQSSTIGQEANLVQSVFSPTIARRSVDTSTERCSGKGTQSGQSRVLFSDFSSSKKERKVSTCHRSVQTESVYQIRELQNGNFHNSQECRSGQRLGSFYRSDGCIPSCADAPFSSQVSTIYNGGPNLSVSGSPIWFKHSSSGVHQIDGCHSCVSTPAVSVSSSLFRRLVDKEQVTTEADIRHSQLSLTDIFSGVNTEFREIGTNSNPTFHFYRDGISYGQEHCESSYRSYASTIGNDFSVHTCQQSFGSNFPVPFGQTECSGRFNIFGPIASSSSPNITVVSLETSHMFSGSQYSDHRHYSIPSQLVVRSESLSTGSSNSSIRTSFLPVYRCKSLGLGSSSRTTGTNISWCLDGRSICSARQYSGDVGHQTCVETNKLDPSSLMCDGIFGQHYSSVLPEETGGDSFSIFMSRSMENTPLVSNSGYHVTDQTYSRENQYSSRPIVQARQTDSNRMVAEPIGCSTHLSDFGSTHGRSFCDSVQSSAPVLCIPDSGHQSICSRCDVNELGQSSCICIPAVSVDSGNLIEDSQFTVQGHSDCTNVVSEIMVHGSSGVTYISSNTTSSSSKPSNSTKRKVSSSKHSNAPPTRLGIVKQSIRANQFSEEVADLVAKSRRPSTRKVYDAKWAVFSNWCCKRKIDPVSVTIKSVADFLLYLFRDKKCQISTIKGYRSTISNTLKFISGRLIGSDPVLSELMKSFELQRPVQRSLTPKWNLSWVLLSLCEPPFEPLHKASRLHVTMKTAFLLALASARRRSEIHAFSVDPEHLRFNKIDGSVSLLCQTGFLAKNQIPSVSPDSIIIPNLAKTCNRDNKDRLLCPIRALKFYLKMSSSYRQGRTRLFLPIRGNHDISKASISRWISYTIKLAYRKLTSRDISFLKIKAHELRAFASSWAYLNKAPLDDVMKAAVWNRKSTFTKFYLRDMSSQQQSLHLLGPLVTAQKVVGGNQSSCPQ